MTDRVQQGTNLWYSEVLLMTESMRWAGTRTVLLRVYATPRTILVSCNMGLN